jgi:hypothetical protein
MDYFLDLQQIIDSACSKFKKRICVLRYDQPEKIALSRAGIF